jgi:hypothetical protein
MGGLGNQMFQYAIARNLAYKNNDEIKLDIRWYKKYGLREYLLGHFNIIESYADSAEIQKIKRSKKGSPTIFRKLFLNLFSKNYLYYKEEIFGYNTEIFKFKGNICLEGYWQSEKYFSDISDVIRNEFTLKTEPDEKNSKLLCQIKNCNAVALHVRRGDYLTNSVTSKILSTCSLDYYSRCIDIIAKKIDNSHFFVFSDDLKWSRDNIRPNFPTTYVSHNGPDKAHEDLRLMSQCKHFIIANSSFSWWGAWLSSNPNKIVLAPKRWFKQNIDTKDLIPGGWIQV